MSNDDNNRLRPASLRRPVDHPRLVRRVLRAARVGGTVRIEQWLPQWDIFVILGVMMVVERIYTYRYAVSQRHVLARDIASTLVNLYLTAAVTGFILLPGLLLLTEVRARTPADGRVAGATRPGVAAGPLNLADRQLFPLLDAPLAALERVFVEAAFLSPPRDGSEGDEHVRLAPGRLRAAQRHRVHACSASSASIRSRC